MKTPLILANAALLLALASCNSKQNQEASADSLSTSTETTTVTTKVIPGSYVDLTTGKTVYIVTDPETGYAMDSIEKVPIEFYISPATHDTLYMTGEVVNHDLVNTSGKWSLSPDAKIKFDGDKMKVKEGDTKIKIDGDKSKVKEGDDYKKKVEADGDTKTKDGDTKTKVKGN